MTAIKFADTKQKQNGTLRRKNHVWNSFASEQSQLTKMNLGLSIYDSGSKSKVFNFKYVEHIHEHSSVLLLCIIF